MIFTPGSSQKKTHSCIRADTSPMFSAHTYGSNSDDILFCGDYIIFVFQDVARGEEHLCSPFFGSFMSTLNLRMAVGGRGMNGTPQSTQWFNHGETDSNFVT